MSGMSLHDLLNQTKRWSVVLLDVSFSKHSPITYGVQHLNLFWALCYSFYSLWPIQTIPIIIYAFLPQLALLNSFSIFPKITDPWFYLYVLLAVGAYGHDFLNYFKIAGQTFQRWWNNQRMWIIRGLSSFLFGSVEYILKSLGISTFGFNVTSKVVDNELSKRYEQGVEFGVESPMFLPITMAAIINLVSFIWGIMGLRYRISVENLFMQVLIAGFAVVNSWPIYEAMVLRVDKGKMPMKITLTSIVLAWVLYLASSLAF